jgi:pimeloyl-ACP methyl ester carboxylesterase
VIAIDARGHGESEKPHDSAFYGEARMAKDVSELADHLGLTSFDLAGYSMGAIVSVIVASQEPRVRRLVIGGIGDGVVDMGGVDTRVVNNLDLAAALVAEDTSTLSPAVASFRRFAESTGADRHALAAQARAVHKSRIPLDRISAPSALIVGDKDPLASRPERLAAAVNGAVLTVLPGDHLGVVGHPGFREAIVAFVNG